MTADPNTDSLWRAYHADRSVANRNALVVAYTPMVKNIASVVAGKARAGGAVDIEDLASAGIFGLMRVIESFDPSRGWKFATYAAGRVRGAMLDHLRAMDWVP